MLGTLVGVIAALNGFVFSATTALQQQVQYLSWVISMLGWLLCALGGISAQIGKIVKEVEAQGERAERLASSRATTP
jgi:hypothetical protein